MDESSNRATDATYTVHHQGGSSPVVVNQQVNGGQWYLLGTFNLDPSSNHRVELSDEANGTVVADAVYIVPSSVAQNSVTWEPTLTSSELVDVYAKWVEGADRSGQVSYTVHHSGGSSVINMNQRANGSVWIWLGRFTMNPSSNHRVEVTDSTDGIVVADAVRFVSVTTSGAGLMYVHSDHLGTPQKMTNESQTLVWDAVSEPFGEPYSITGTASTNQRFPGQYFDSESGYSQNWFRDFDPTTGRYLQNDPVDLKDGLNRYAYVGNSPTKFADRLGLFKTTGELANPKDNTIVCDGNGGIMMQIPDSNFTGLEKLCGIKDCVKAHERSHLNEADVRNPGICRNRPAGAQVFFSYGEQQDSEYTAWTQHIRCLKRKQKNAQCACKITLDQEIKRAESQQRKYKP